MRRAAYLTVLLALFACEGSIGDGGSGPGTTIIDDVEVEDCDTCVGPSTLTRLTRAEYKGTVYGVFGAGLRDAFELDRLPGDGREGPFSSNASLLVDDAAVQAYRDVAERAAGAIADDASCADAACAEAFLARAGEGLFRQPLSTEERGAYLSLLEGVDVPTGVRLMATALLQSPRFLYRVEIGVGEVQPGVAVLSGREVATRLAYFFTSASPDEELLAAADRGDLNTAEGIREEARRLLADPRSDEMIVAFYHGWLGLDSLQQRTPDPAEHPEFASLQSEIVEETHAFVLATMRGSARFEDLFTATHTYGSDELAAYYGSEAGVLTDESALPRIELNPAERSGLLTQAAVISAHTVEDSTAGVHRGKFIRENMLCLNLPPPPPVDAVITPDEGLSTRQRFERKTESDGCILCHALLNPTGFLLEHYDLTGAYRDMDGPFAIDATGALPGSDITGPLDGALELSAALSTSDDARHCMVRQWFRFAMARTDTTEDASSLQQVFNAFAENDYDLNELLLEMTASPAFRLRRAPE
ncbi:MAG: hypothetical protein ACI9KE_002694 [Polyangiales bacterium]|jgi:hypothetical protein